MADTDPHSGEHSVESSISPSVLSELTARMTEALSKAPTSILATDSAIAPIGIKLDGTNYALWSQVVEMYVAGKDKLGYINSDLPQPLTTDPSFRRWRTENATVKGWLIGLMDPSLIGNFIRFPTAKQVWDAIATTYFDGSDATQVYELRRRVARLRQGSGSLEKYYNDLQGLWREIDFRRPNPMQCPADIQHFNNMLSDVLQLKPFPTVEQAYAHVRREAVRQAVMTASNGEEAAGAVMASRSLKQGPSTVANSLSLNGKFSKSNGPSNDMKCSHCGNSKHTRDTCFKLHGYPDWWHELQAKRRRDGNGKDGGASKNATNGTGKAAIASAESQLSLIPTTTVDLDTGMSFLETNTIESYDGWILDSGATDHMTYDASDFSERSSPRRTSIANANGDISLVKGAGTVMISPALSLTNTLFDILTKEIIGCGTKKGGLYYMEDFSISQANHTRSSSDRNKANILLWHRRLGHPSFGYLKLVFPALFSGLSNLDFKCETCILAKSHRVSYPLSFNKSQMPFELIHSDVWGPSPKSTISGVRWFVIFVDDCTRMTWLYLMKNKDEVFSVFCSFHEMVKTQYSATIRILRSDNGGEYMHQTARAILLGAHVPNHFWTDAVTTAVHLINRMPSRVLKFKTPLQALSTVISLPTTLMLPPRVFGCVAFVHLHKNQRTKLDPCAIRCLFLGYGLHQKRYRCYDPSNHRTYVTMDVTFLESETFYSPTTSTSTLQGAPQNKELNWLRFDWEPVVSESNTELDVEPVVFLSKDPSPENIPEVSSLNTLSTPVLTNDVHVGYELPYRHNRGKPPDRYSPNIEDWRLKYPIANYVSTKTLPEPLKTFADALSSCQVPTSVEEAMKDPRTENSGVQVGVFYQYKVDGTIERYKARLVAKGFTQTYGVDYQETFSPVAKLNTMRVLLSLAANLDWPLHQFDVKNAFLHGDLEEDIYMDIPSGYVANTEGNIVCKLQRTLYGLKQSPQAWFGRFSTATKKYGFQQSNSDHTLFLKHRQGKLTALIVYVDDMIITGDDSEEIARLQEQLASEFEMKNLGGLKYFLGIEVAKSKRVSVVSQFMHCPSEDHMSAVMQILRYLKSSPGKGLMFSKNDHLRAEGYTDADWAGNIMDRKSTSGYFTFVGGNLVTWRSKKQKVVALSSAEAEFRGMAKGLCELLWLRRLLTEIGFAPDSEMKLFCDNKAAIDISHNPVQHDWTKHVEVDQHFIKQNLDAKIIQFLFMKSEDQLADILTKVVSSKIFHHSLDKLGLIDIYVPT
ncbi:Retrovirus-related Pol polyprotein from transposon TNT 1-94 [Vitis vinifera]|uniref:Retrovirus-related Pol polyprotein from transposon TNT 1-94 n=1 Tax=Vitis vinifera TaxID=29760 RepID=A0A438GG85_VITVI|nr:Retrovirus-related Pol polyprotein from transposon TNT 1-94 [Vitis vinifera]